MFRYFFTNYYSIYLPEEYEKDPQTYLVVAVHGKNMKTFQSMLRKLANQLYL